MNLAVGTRWIRTFAAVAAFLGMLGAPGCYSSRTRLPEYAKSIAVPVFANKTYIDEYTRKLEVEVTESTRKALLTNGKLAVQGRESADLIMEGQVNKYDRRILRADRYGEPAEVQIVIHVSVSVYDVKAAKYLVQGVIVTNDREKTGYGSYNLRRGEDEALARKQAIEEIGRVIAHKALDY
ncbi:MAG: hypothetical protein KIS92_04010 [Planctomycetota bacterium]|nr:hypothetical protein [Planctomycetota bacterium]